MKKRLVKFIDEREHKMVYLKLTDESIKFLDWLIDEGYIEEVSYICDDDDIQVIEF